LTLPSGKYAVGRGLFYSEIIEPDSDSTPPLMTLPPRYRSHEEELSSIYVLAGVQDIGAVKGFKAFWNWLKELFGFRPEETATGSARFVSNGTSNTLAT